MLGLLMNILVGKSAAFLGLEFTKSFEVGLKVRVASSVVFEDVEALDDDGFEPIGNAVEIPVGSPFHGKHISTLHVAQVLRGLHLRLLNRVLNLAHAKRISLGEEMSNAQASGVAQAFVECDQFHRAARRLAIGMRQAEYTHIGMYRRF